MYLPNVWYQITKPYTEQATCNAICNTNQQGLQITYVMMIIIL